MTALIHKNIDKAIMAIASNKTPREYLGASSIGAECDRQLWYSFHREKPLLDPRIYRIFDQGHLMESYCISMLKHAGYEVFHDDGGEQFGFKDEEVAGHIDAVIIIDNEPHLLEIKTANDKRFAEMKKFGVEKSDPVYFIQMQVYMKYMDLKKALFFVINKNTSEIYMEIVGYESIKATYYVNRGKEIIRGKEEEAERKYKSKAFFRCKFCDYKEECWAGYGEPSGLDEESVASFKLGENLLLRK
jgi:hypothetical protein